MKHAARVGRASQTAEGRCQKSEGPVVRSGTVNGVTVPSRNRRELESLGTEAGIGNIVAETVMLHDCGTARAGGRRSRTQGNGQSGPRGKHRGAAWVQTACHVNCCAGIDAA